MAKSIATPSKILLRVPNWVGDAVMSLPALEQLRQKFPAAEVVVLARPTVADLYRHLPAVSRVLVFDQRGRHRGLSGLRRLASELRRQRFDLAVLFQNAFQAA
ncbi:MAG: glycosyltransferase family 9 protein, partial [Candidatus Acidiferrales bacterium]